MFDSYLQNTHEWLKTVGRYGGWESQPRSLAVLRATLHHLRDHLTIDHSAHFAAQLPLLIKGIYYDGWVPAQVPIKERSVDEFIAAVAADLQSTSLHEAQSSIEAVLMTLQYYISEGEIDKVQNVLPKSIRQLWENIA